MKICGSKSIAADKEKLFDDERLKPDVIDANAAKRRKLRQVIDCVSFLILAGVSGSGFLSDVREKELEADKAEKARIEAKAKAETEREFEVYQQKREKWLAENKSSNVKAAVEHMKKADLKHPVLKDAVMAARCADVNALRIICVNGKINWQDPEIMIAACKTPFLLNVRFVHSHGGNVNAKSENGVTPLMESSSRGHFEIVKYLVEHGADVNARSVTSMSALFFASKWGYLEIVKCLVEHGADVNAKRNDGLTALDFTQGDKRQDVVDYLCSKGARSGKSWFSW